MPLDGTQPVRWLRPVMFGLLVVALLLPAALPPTAPTTHAQQTPPAAGGFIRAAGTQLTLNGQPVSLKGIDYRIPNYTREDVWHYWDATRVAHDLTRARTEMGVNTVWVRVPYTIDGISEEGYVTPELVTRMREFVQIAGSLDLRVVFTLFDGYERFPAPGRDEERVNIEYVRGLLDNFKDDDRVLGWNIYPNPDRNGILRAGDLYRVLNWVVRMAANARAAAPNQLMMVSMDDPTYLWVPDIDGNTLISFVDVVALRVGDRPLAALHERLELLQVQVAGNKPILLTEASWATGPACRTRGDTPEQQAIYYGAILNYVATGVASGAMYTPLMDSDSGPLRSWDSNAFYTGLYRIDGTLKPAGDALAAVPVAALPANTSSNLALRITGYPPRFEPSDYLLADAPAEPVQVAGTPYYIKDWFRVAYETFGGEYSFGKPLSHPFERASDGVVVQFFEAALLELDSKASGRDSFRDLGRIQKIQAVVQVNPIGSSFTAGRTFAPPADTPQGADVRYFPETGHYIRGDFYRFYVRANGAWRLGMPLSEELIEEIGGTPLIVQYFERGRVERDPQSGAFRFGQLGQWAWNVQCEQAP